MMRRRRDKHTSHSTALMVTQWSSGDTVQRHVKLSLSVLSLSWRSRKQDIVFDLDEEDEVWTKTKEVTAVM